MQKMMLVRNDGFRLGFTTFALRIRKNSWTCHVLNLCNLSFLTFMWSLPTENISHLWKQIRI